MKKLILATAITASLLKPVMADELKIEKTAVKLPVDYSIVKDTARLTTGITYSVVKGGAYRNKLAHLVITDAAINLAKKIPILKKHPKITAIAVGAGYYLIWDTLIQGQVDIAALIADGTAVIINLIGD